MITLTSGEMSKLHLHACNAIAQSHDDALREIANKSIRRNQWENIFTAHLCRVMYQVARAWKTELTTSYPGLD